MDRKTHSTKPYPAEFRERAVQMVIDHFDSYTTLTAEVRDIAGKLGCSPDSLRVWYKQARSCPIPWCSSWLARRMSALPS